MAHLPAKGIADLGQSESSVDGSDDLSYSSMEGGQNPPYFSLSAERVASSELSAFCVRKACGGGTWAQFLRGMSPSSLLLSNLPTNAAVGVQGTNAPARW